MNQYYVVVVEGDVEPHVHGPFDDQDERDMIAAAFRAEDEALENGIFALDIVNGKVDMWSYGSGELEDDEDEDTED